ncbi:unnamed protein product [Citrullus colocynthis]|uniref:Uncharacterized protein n=1 Tax=Citrullus colocynthis TaxID=252529 RepID=A0ABP0XXJ4_9ROSI
MANMCADGVVDHILISCTNIRKCNEQYRGTFSMMSCLLFQVLSKPSKIQLMVDHPWMEVKFDAWNVAMIDS